MNEWDWDNYYDYEINKDLNLTPEVTAKFCNHEWKATYLIFSHVYDCVKCGKKKEECT